MIARTVPTAYGLLDQQALEEARSSFDTRLLLAMVDELDRLNLTISQDGGLRAQLLDLHGMAHSVINDARLCAPAHESLPDMAGSVLTEVQAIVEMLRRWSEPLQTLQRLAALE